MKIERILDIRFFAPPGLMIFFIFLFSPLDFINLVTKGQSVSWIFSIIGILGLGFLISTITDFFVNLFGSRINTKCKESYKNIEILKGIFNHNNEEDAIELASWIVLDKTDTEKNGHIRDQIHKRWNMAMANFNSVAAIVFAWIAIGVFYCKELVTLQSYAWPIAYFLFSIAFLIMFLFNGERARRSVLNMDCMLISYGKDIKSFKKTITNSSDREA